MTTGFDSTSFRFASITFRLRFDVVSISFRCLARFRLESIHPGHSLEEIVEMTGFDFDKPSTISETKPPSSDTLKLIRGKIADEISETYPAFSSKLFGA